MYSFNIIIINLLFKNTNIQKIKVQESGMMIYQKIMITKNRFTNGSKMVS